MGSNPYTLLEEDLACPLCKKPLSSPGSGTTKVKASKVGKRGKGRPPFLLSNYPPAPKDVVKAGLGRPKDNEEIVVAQCGHLFHRFCLRHFCYLKDGQTSHMCRTRCPICQRSISMMSSQTVEYKAHQDRSTDVEKNYTKTSVMHSELSGQVDTVKKKHERLCEKVEDGDQNLEVYRFHCRRLKNELKQAKTAQHKIDGLKNDLDHTDKMLTFMQSQHLKIVRKFIAKVKPKSPKHFVHFPRRLAPYLTIIEKDDRMVRDLGEVIVPIHLNNLKSDRHSLLKGILTTACERLDAEPEKEEKGKTDKSIFVMTPKKDSTGKTPHPQVIVKVRKSSVSILSSSVLTRESIQQIMENVKNIQGAKAKVRKENPDAKKKANGQEIVLNHLSSSSDVQILFMPKRKAHQSEPCRSIEETDSFHAGVPSRKCRSTDAILVKTKRKEKKNTIRSKARKRKSTLPLEVKKSNSIADISTSTEKIEKKEILLLKPKSRPSPCSGQAQIIEHCHEHLRKENGQGSIFFKNKEEVDLNNNFISDDLSPVLTPTSSRSDLNVGHCETNQLSSPTGPRRRSLLEMIYDELEEEKNFHTSRSYGSLGWGSSTCDTVGNELLPQPTFSQTPRLNPFAQTPTYDPVATDCMESLNSPKFFRVDRKGMLHPESPYHTTFRRPTFLASNSEIKEEEKRSDFATGSDEPEPDEENQLGALSPEERVIAAAAKVVPLPTANTNNYGCIGRRPVFHGIPACLGMPNAQRFEAFMDRRNTPIYLKKWQQQLMSSRRDAGAAPKYRMSTSNVNHSSQNNATPLVSPSPKGIHQQRKPSGRNKKESDCNILPPLSMYPSKRPSTADCMKMAENGDAGDHERGEREMILSMMRREYYS